MIVLWSDAARQSHWVLAEASRALDNGKLIQGNLSDRLPPMPFDQIQTADLRAWQGEDDHPEWGRIAASVHFLAGSKAPPLGLLSNARRPAGSDSAIRPAKLAAVAAAVMALALLPLVAGHFLLAESQMFLRSPFIALAVFIVMLTLLLTLPVRAPRVRAAFVAGGDPPAGPIAGSVRASRGTVARALPLRH